MKCLDGVSEKRVIDLDGPFECDGIDTHAMMTPPRIIGIARKPLTRAAAWHQARVSAGVHETDGDDDQN